MYIYWVGCKIMIYCCLASAHRHLLSCYAITIFFPVLGAKGGVGIYRYIQQKTWMFLPSLCSASYLINSMCGIFEFFHSCKILNQSLYNSSNRASFLITLPICMQVSLSAFDSGASLEVLDHPILDLIYYMVFYWVFLFIILVSLSYI